MLFEFQNKMNIGIIGFLLIQCGFALDSLHIDLLNIDLSDTNLHLLDTDIPSKYFVDLQDVFKTSAEDVVMTSDV